jgi:hypothetical protein
MEIRKRRRKRQKKKKGGGKKNKFCWLMRDNKATPLLNIYQFMLCLESRMKHKTVALHFLWSK